MSVDFYTCKACAATFPDCGYYASCSEDEIGCGAHYCSDKCAQIRKPEIVDDLTWDEFAKLTDEEQAKRRTTCVDCRNELESDENLLLFLLNKLNKSHAELLSEFRAAKRPTSSA